MCITADAGATSRIDHLEFINRLKNALKSNLLCSFLSFLVAFFGQRSTKCLDMKFRIFTRRRRRKVSEEKYVDHLDDDDVREPRLVWTLFGSKNLTETKTNISNMMIDRPICFFISSHHH